MAISHNQSAATACVPLAAACLGVTIVLGTGSLMGWVLDVPALRRFLALGTGTMDPVTAVVLTGLAAGVVLLILVPPSRFGIALTRVLALAALGVGLLRLGSIGGLWAFRVDKVLFPAGLVPSGGPAMGGLTAVAVVLVGAALALLTTPRTIPLAQLALLGVALGAGLALSGHLYGAVALQGAMPLGTAIGCLALAVAALAARPEPGWVAMVRDGGPGGKLVRTILPGILLVPLVLGWLRVQGEARGLFDRGTGVALNTVAAAVLLAGLTWWAARSLRAADQKRRQAEAALAESEQRYRLFFETNPVPAWVYDLETLRFLAVNDAAVRAYGYSRAEFLAMTIKDIRPPEEVPRLLAAVQRTRVHGPQVGVWRHQRRNGECFEVEITGHTLAVGGRPAELVLAQDVTERRRLEAELRASEERFRTLAHTAADAIVSADGTGSLTYLNPAAERLFGYGNDEARGQPIAILMPERFREAHRRGLERYLQTGESRVLGRSLELVGLRKDGTEVPIELSLGSWRRGEEVAFTAFIRDITERKRAEDQLRQYAAQLEAANAELDAFAYSVSHDLRAPLRSIDGFSQALLEDCGDRLDAAGRDHLQRVRAATQRMGRLIDDLLTLSRVTREPMHRAPVDLSALAAGIAAELSEHEPARRVEWVIAPGVQAVGDRRLLRVALTNLLGNAWKYTARVSRARIEFGCEAAAGTEPVFWVRDNGAGFDMAYADKLFVPFQRLHGAAEFDGTGVGLATVARIVRRHGGRIWAEGEVGRGAAFFFTL